MMLSNQLFTDPYPIERTSGERQDLSDSAGNATDQEFGCRFEMLARHCDDQTSIETVARQ
jgi:hypothetical protein